jgi:hypothetical protein
MEKVIFSKCKAINDRRQWLLDYFLANHAVPSVRMFVCNWQLTPAAMYCDLFYVLDSLFGKDSVYRYLTMHGFTERMSVSRYVFKLAYSSLMTDKMKEEVKLMPSGRVVIKHANGKFGYKEDPIEDISVTEEDSIKDTSDGYTSVLKSTIERIHCAHEWMSIKLINGVSILIYRDSLQYSYNKKVLDKLTDGSVVYIKHTRIMWVIKDERTYMNVAGYFVIKPV